jgi:VCBS repeat-containing protein
VNSADLVLEKLEERLLLSGVSPDAALELEEDIVDGSYGGVEEDGLIRAAADFGTVNVELELHDLDGSPGIQVGEEFEVEVDFVDVREPEDPQAVFSGYADVEFDPALVQLDAIVHDDDFTGGATGTIDNETGVADEVGGADGLTPVEDTRVFTLQMTALAPGSVVIASNVAEAPLSQIVVFGSELDHRDNADYGALEVLLGEAPTDITISSAEVPENQPAGVVVGDFDTVDQDAGESFDYELATGEGDEDNGSFSIDGGSLLTAGSFDFEAQDTYSIRVRSSDSGEEWVEEPFTISVVDVNDAPTAAGDDDATDEDTAITTVNVLENDTDPDAGDTLSVSDVDTSETTGLVTDNGDGTFLYDPNGAFDHLAPGDSAEDRFTYTARDGNGASDTATVVVTVEGVNDVPHLDLTSPQTGETVVRDTDYELSWTDSDPDDDAVVDLWWDLDRERGNNTDENPNGWGWIARNVSENEGTDAFSWHVELPEGSDCYLGGAISDGEAEVIDYTENTLHVRSYALMGTNLYEGGARVSFYDMDPSDDGPQAQIAWTPQDRNGDTDVMVLPGRGGEIRRMVLLDGAGGLEDVGIVVEGSGLGALVDGRRTSDDPLSFLASEGEVGLVRLNSALTGADLDGFVAEGGWSLPGGIVPDDVGLHTPAGLGRVITRGEIAGDVVSGEDMGVLQVIGANITGVVRSGGDLRVLKVIGGDIGGAVDVEGDMMVGMAIGRGGGGGSITGPVEVEGSARVLKAIGGDIGPVTVDGDLRVLQAIGGDILGPVEVTGGLNVAMALARGAEGGTIGGTVDVDQNLGVLRAVGGSIDQQVTVGGDARVVQSIGGDLAGFLDVEGDLRVAMAFGRGGAGGSVSGGADVEGSVNVIKAIHGSITAPVAAGGDLNVVMAVGGRIGGDLTAGSMGPDGAIRVVKAIGGDIEGRVDASGSVGTVVAVNRGGAGGTISGDLSAGDGLGGIIARRDLTGNVNVTGRLGRAIAGGDIAGCAIDADRAGLLRAGGTMENVAVDVDGDLGLAFTGDDMANTTVDAGSLGRVIVRGEITDDDGDGDHDRIRARDGRYFAMDRTQRGWVDGGERFGEMWFDEGEPDGVRAWCG